MSKGIDSVPDKQRVLILQGGGALGAYDAGVVKALIDELPKIDAENGESGRPIFDIIAGTSSGAINAALLMSYFRDAKTWNGADDRIAKFWNESSSDPAQDVDFWIHWWDSEHRHDSHAATHEAARRYYSAKHFLQEGAEGVFSGPKMVLDKRFFDNGSFPNNIWFQYENQGLRKKIEAFGFPIATSYDNGQPRLLLVSTSIRDGATVTFDSYSKESEFGRLRKDIESHKKQTLRYPNGVELRHVMASASVPLFYKFEEIEGEHFCDGGVLSNTPFREVLQAHRDYWYKKRGQSKPESKVPALEVYIVSVWPSAANSDGQGSNGADPKDYDGIKGRLYDIGLSDKTEVDEKMAVVVSDYIEMINHITNLAYSNLAGKEHKDAFLKDLRTLLASKAQSRDRNGKQRQYKSLIEGRAKLSKEVVRIEFKGDETSGISNKFFDLSKKTIQDLIDQGEKDGREALHRAARERRKEQ